MAANVTLPEALPPLPTYELTQVSSLIPGVDDFYVSLMAPVVAYWIVSGIFHFIDVFDLFPQYRLHTPAEIASRNRASRYEVFRDPSSTPPEFNGKEDYDVAVWATRVRLAQRALPSMLAMLGINAASMAKSMSATHPLIAGALSGGHYPFLTTGLAGPDGSTVPAFATWEIAVAKAIFWMIIPAMQFGVASPFPRYLAILVASHHAHQQVAIRYLPFAPPPPGFLLDTLGAGIAYKLSFMTARQGIVFFTASTIKTVDDHCGYSLPWDPLQHISANNAAYHDIHHQSWGIKTNFSQPFFTFWDSFLGTMWKGDTSLKYERSRKNAENAIEAEAKKARSS
ncbi:hypothetical protein PG989_007858 [Apiospora arundinis]